MCLFIIQEIKETEKKRKREIKSKKIDKKKRTPDYFIYISNQRECQSI